MAKSRRCKLTKPTRQQVFEVWLVCYMQKDIEEKIGGLQQTVSDRIEEFLEKPEAGELDEQGIPGKKREG